MFGVQAEGNAVVEFFEGVTTDDDGARLTGRDLNRVTANAPTTAIYRDPNVTDDGTELTKYLLPAGRRARASGGLAQERNVRILKAGKYLLRVTNESGGAAMISAILEWTEPNGS